MRNTMMIAAMAANHLALLGALKHGPLETKDGEPSNAEIKETIDGIGTAFDAFKKKNDERLEQIEKKGVADVVTKEELERVNGELSKLTEIKADLEKLQIKANRPGGDGSCDGKRETKEALAHKAAFENFLRSGGSGTAETELKEAEKEWKASLEPEERKAVDTLTGGAGGIAVPEMISGRVERELSEAVGLRNLVDVVPAGSPDFKTIVDTRGQAFGWVGETDARAETATASLEEIAPTFGTIYAYPKASEESLDDMFFNVENWIVTSANEAFLEGEDAAIVSGNGTKKPTGFLNGTPTAEKDGTRPFGTLQFTASGAAAALAADPMLDIVHTLKRGYRSNANWLMNKLTTAAVRKLKDGDGDYLWRPGLEMGQPNTLLGYSVTECEDMPDIAADSLPIAFGDFKAGYILVPLVGLRITRDEVTEPGYVKWYVRRRVGGQVKKSEAIKLLKIAA